ncbi:vitellogenin-3 [Drosophila tropicalis]|uniref:vitellogenin-3 n=1 Tax=Drosophila tropicalis TaxID=46794 RepID=UPI0035AB8085
MTVKQIKKLNNFQLILLVLPLISPLNAIEFSIPDVLGSMVSLGVSFVDSSILPTAKGIFENSKNLLAGYPFQVVASSINAICSQAVGTNNVKSKYTPDISKMSFQLRTACTKQSYPLLHPEGLWQSKDFDPNKKVVILATGWTTTVNGSDTIDLFSKAYNCRGDVNFVAIDAAQFVDTLYSWSAFNTGEIGAIIARSLVKLLEVVPVRNIHLIGHSLGAHIVGATGRFLHEYTGQKIPHITGLDPAKPCFNEGETLSGLMRGDGAFVDVIHSNSGVLGKREPLGDVDFYPDGTGPLPSGCLTAICAHSRSWQYYLESIYPGNELNFMSAQCNSISSLRDKRCPGVLQPMGYAVPHFVKGNYFLEVKSSEPYGYGSSENRTVEYKNCGLCPKS